MSSKAVEDPLEVCFGGEGPGKGKSLLVWKYLLLPTLCCFPPHPTPPPPLAVCLGLVTLQLYLFAKLGHSRVLRGDSPMADRSAPLGTVPGSFMTPEESEPGSKSNLKRKKMKAVLLLKANLRRSLRI